MDHLEEIDKKMMLRALELAALGKGQVSPGPLVGCVILNNIGEIAGEGTYYFDDVVHAEAVALEQALLPVKGGTAYISLEPHSHHGRTPPCTAALIEAGITRVVAPMEDPNPLVSGKGFAELVDNGIEVSIGLLRTEAEKLNEKFVHWHKKKRPFIHVKLASSIDGKIATRTGDSKWITGEAARDRGQQLRGDSDAIMVGIGTVEADDPLLTDRSGAKRRRALLRVVLDSSLRIDFDSRIVQTASEFPTLIVTDTASENDKINRLRGAGAEVVQVEGGGHNLEGVMAALVERSIQSVLLEGGASVAGSFFDKKLVDKATFFTAPVVIGGSGAPNSVAGKGPEHLSEAFRLSDVTVSECGGDIEISGYPAQVSEAGNENCE